MRSIMYINKIYNNISYTYKYTAIISDFKELGEIIKNTNYK